MNAGSQGITIKICQGRLGVSCCYPEERRIFKEAQGPATASGLLSHTASQAVAELPNPLLN